MAEETVIGIDTARGCAELDARTDSIWWRQDSMFMCAGVENVLPRFHHSNPPAAAVMGLGSRASKRHVAVAFEPTPAAVEWARAGGLELLCPPPDLYRAVGNKLNLPRIAAEAGVTSPASVTLDPSDELPGDFGYPTADRPLVMQRPEDCLTGAGTRLVRSRTEMAACRHAWRGMRLKVVELTPGLPLSVSGFVARDRTLVSVVSHQLVGVPPMTSMWGRYCGNQLLTEADLPSGAIAACEETCARVGNALREWGFLGSFGLDLVLTATGNASVIEINPRFQGATALITALELSHDLLPTFGVHVLSFLCESLPPAVRRSRLGTPLSQMFFYAPRAGVVARALPKGVYRLADEGIEWVSDAPSVAVITLDDLVVWPWVSAGQHVDEGDRVALLQCRRRVATIETSPRLLVPPPILSAMDSLIRPHRETARATKSATGEA